MIVETDYQRIDKALADRGRSSSSNVFHEGSTIKDWGTLQTRSRTAVLFTFDKAGKLCFVRRHIKAAWLLRGTGLSLRAFFTRRF